MNEKNYLAHYGVLGMKWGKRKGRFSIGRQKDLSQYSDDELRRRINRLQMEQQYKGLSKKKVGAGRQAVNTLKNDLVAGVTITGAAITLYNNIDKLVPIVKTMYSNPKVQKVVTNPKVQNVAKKMIRKKN